MDREGTGCIAVPPPAGNRSCNEKCLLTLAFSANTGKRRLGFTVAAEGHSEGEEQGKEKEQEPRARGRKSLK